MKDPRSDNHQITLSEIKNLAQYLASKTTDGILMVDDLGQLHQALLSTESPPKLLNAELASLQENFTFNAVSLEWLEHITFR
jgi:hypothetical protein